MADATLFAQRSLNLVEGGQPEQLRGAARDAVVLHDPRTRADLGRAFTENDAEPGADQFAILTHGLWTTRFGGDRSIVGRDIRLDGVPHRVVGVLPADFELPARDVALLVPFSFTPTDRSDQSRGNEFSAMIARLAPGATVEQARRADGDHRRAAPASGCRSAQAFLERERLHRVRVPIREQLVGDVRTPLLVLQIGVALVLLIACANVANLLLMRATGRYRESGHPHRASAPGGGTLLQQLLTEGLVLSTVGARRRAGARPGRHARSWWRSPMRSCRPRSTPTLEPADAGLHPRAWRWPTGLVFGLVPAWSTMRTDVVSGAARRRHAHLGLAEHRDDARRPRRRRRSRWP